MSGQFDFPLEEAALSGLRRARIDGRPALIYFDSERAYVVDEPLSRLLAEGAAAVGDAVNKAQCGDPVEIDAAELLAPIDDQEVWACGVTYVRSRAARMAESVAGDVYDRVYAASRPEMFLKAPAWRVPVPGAPLRIRRDSEWDVPEPELALVVSAAAELVGYLVADDVSSRQIEGENPLYLPQAKVYDDALGLSDTIVLASQLEPARVASAEISLAISRGGARVFEGSTSVAQMKRSFDELIGYLFAELSHPGGAVLLTGTGLVPPDEVTLEPGDLVDIRIAGVGRLRHTIYRKG